MATINKCIECADISAPIEISQQLYNELFKKNELRKKIFICRSCFCNSIKESQTNLSLLTTKENRDKELFVIALDKTHVIDECFSKKDDAQFHLIQELGAEAIDYSIKSVFYKL